MTSTWRERGVPVDDASVLRAKRRGLPRQRRRQRLGRPADRHDRSPRQHPPRRRHHAIDRVIDAREFHFLPTLVHEDHPAVDPHRQRPRRRGARRPWVGRGRRQLRGRARAFVAHQRLQRRGEPFGVDGQLAQDRREPAVTCRTLPVEDRRLDIPPRQHRMDACRPMLPERHPPATRTGLGHAQPFGARRQGQAQAASQPRAAVRPHPPVGIRTARLDDGRPQLVRETGGDPLHGLAEFLARGTSLHRCPPRSSPRPVVCTRGARTPHFSSFLASAPKQIT